MKNLSRREFVKKGAIAATGISILPESLTILKKGRAIGANDRIRIGLIGCGLRATNVYMEALHRHKNETNIEVVGVCDPWRIAREQINVKVKDSFGREARQFVSHNELLAWDNIDAVMICSPDHLHTIHLEAAALAGKHVYVDKPLTMDLDKLIRAVDAVKKAGIVVQVGTQVRSIPGVVGARELYKSGVLGKFSRIEECRNSEMPYWYRYLREVKKEDTDWKEFLGDRPMRPFNPEVHSAWYGYYEFSHGPISNLGVHFIDTVHFVTGAKFPESCVCLGGNLTWKDKHKFTNPDCIQATWMYPEGFLVSSSNNHGNGLGNVRNFFGDKGSIKMDSWSNPTYTDSGSPNRDGSINGEKPVVLVERPDHFLDWLQCIRTKQATFAPIEAGYQHSVAVLMAMKSYETGRKTIYDQKRRKILTA
jgi:predicted dehydrogenase